MGHTTFSVRIEEETKNKLEGLARTINRTRNYLVNEAIKEFITINEWQLAEIKRAVEKADSPDAVWVDHADVRKKWEAELENEMAQGRRR